MIEKKLYTINEALEIVPLSRSGIFQAIKRGDIPVLRIGKRIFVLGEWIRQSVKLPNENR